MIEVLKSFLVKVSYAFIYLLCLPARVVERLFQGLLDSWGLVRRVPSHVISFAFNKIVFGMKYITLSYLQRVIVNFLSIRVVFEKKWFHLTLDAHLSAWICRRSTSKWSTSDTYQWSSMQWWKPIQLFFSLICPFHLSNSWLDTNLIISWTIFMICTCHFNQLMVFLALKIETHFQACVVYSSRQ